MGFAKEKRPGLNPDDSRLTGLAVSTAASTGLRVGGVYGLATTSTGAPVVYTLQLPKVGDVIEFGVAAIASSSVAPFHINSGAAVFGSTDDMASLSSAGAGFRAIARSSSQWLVTGVRGATFSTST